MGWNRNHKAINNILDSIGSTPLIKLNRLSQGCPANIFVKLEYANPSGSLKDRVVANIVHQAEQRGELKPGMILLEGTTGNTGIGTCMVGAALGYPVIIVMPEGMSEERKKTIRAYGAELILTPGGGTDVDLVLEEVTRVKARYPGKVFEIGQFVRADNAACHYQTTGPEIWEQTSGAVDAFVMCQGTGGTVTGVGRYLKEQNQATRVFIAEPAESPILAYGKIGNHSCQGIADGLIPDILDLNYVDGIILIPSAQAVKTAQQMCQLEGIFGGISSGINIAAAIKLSHAYPELKTIVTIINDNGLRYLSTELCGESNMCRPLEREHEVDTEQWARVAERQLLIIN